MGSINDINNAINKAIEELRTRNFDVGPELYFFEGGSGVPDGMAVEYFKDNPSVIVVTRDGKKWRKGKEET